MDIWATGTCRCSAVGPGAECCAGRAAVLDVLTGDEAEEFVAAYAAALRDAYPPEGDGTTLFPFRRVFIVVSAR